MRRPKAATPAPAAAGNRCQSVGFGRLDAPRSSINDIAAQYDLAARLIAARYQLEPHLANLICRLAGLGTREAA
jgi:hypothetical protein